MDFSPTYGGLRRRRYETGEQDVVSIAQKHADYRWLIVDAIETDGIGVRCPVMPAYVAQRVRVGPAIQRLTRGMQFVESASAWSYRVACCHVQRVSWPSSQAWNRLFSLFVLGTDLRQGLLTLLDAVGVRQMVTGSVGGNEGSIQRAALRGSPFLSPKPTLERQAERHERQSYQDEFLAFLRRHGINFE
ncbi:MAG: hypothetical protein ACYC6N_00145 [Pirellulaceae bacterium]